MNLVAYGVASATDMLKNILLIKLTTGETLVSYCQHNPDGGIVTFLPMELVRQEDDSFVLRSFLPFVSEKLFYIHLDSIQIIKGTVLQYVKDQYKKLTETLYKDDIEEFLFSAESFHTVEAEIELQSGVSVH